MGYFRPVIRAPLSAHCNALDRTIRILDSPTRRKFLSKMCGMLWITGTNKMRIKRIHGDVI